MIELGNCLSCDKPLQAPENHIEMSASRRVFIDAQCVCGRILRYYASESGWRCDEPRRPVTGNGK